jgi:O-antigen/teichoic acid export membrane protein
MVYAAAYLATSALVAIRRTGVVVGGAVIALVVNLALNLALLPRFAGTGAGFATTASYALEAAVLLVALSHMTGRIRVLAPLWPPAVAAAAMTVWLVLSPLPALVEIIIGTGAYAALWLALVSRVRPEQLDVLRELLPNRRGSRA